MEQDLLPVKTIEDNGSINSRLQSTGGITVPLVIFILLGLYYSATTPLWTPPDEERHFAYCEYIAHNHALPAYRYHPDQNMVGMAFHPPLYYVIGSFFCSDDDTLLEEAIRFSDGPGYLSIVHPAEEASISYAGKARSARLLRLYSLALSLLNLLLIYLLALSVFPGEVMLASATTLFVATNPQFLHISASVSSDNLAAMLSTAYLLSLVTVMQDSSRIRRQLVCGTLLGLCLLSKSFVLFYLPVTLCFLIWNSLSNKSNPVPCCCIILGTALLIGGWWYARNWLDGRDPLLSKTVLAYYPWFKRHASLSITDAGRMITQTFVSFFGYFGAFQFTLHKLHLYAYGFIMLLGVAGMYPLFTRVTMTPFQYRALGMLCFALLGGIASFLLLNIQYIGSAMGRYLFVVIAPIALLTSAGLWSLVPSRRRNVFLAVISLTLVALSLDVYSRVLKPAYADPGMVMGNVQPLFSLPSTEISRSSTVGQSFRAPLNRLSAIQVMFSNPSRPQAGEIIFSLVEEAGGGVIRQAAFPVRRIQDNTRYFFIFPPIDGSRGKKYIFRISAPSLEPGSRLSLWQETRDCYVEGAALLNSESQAGDLYFTTWFFTGDHPETDWQGTRELVMQQGLYVDIREIQLYYEQSRAFREKTETHQKILRLQQAISNRKALMESTDHA